MRWLVEVGSLGKTEMQKFCVEAESWQRALQAARAQRGEDGPMSGFSIELLEEGYRAVDPMARVRFVVKRAPDDMPVTTPLAKDSKAGVAPAKPSTAAPAAPAASANAGATEPKLPVAPVSSSPVAGGSKKSVPPRPGSDKNVGAAAALAPQPVPAVAVAVAVPPAPSSANVTSTTQQTPEAKKKAQTIAFGSGGEIVESASPKVSPQPPPPEVVSAPPGAETPRSAPPRLSIGSALPNLPATKLLTSREQDPTDASPLTYREYAFALPSGTAEETAADVLRGQLKIVDAHLGDARSGKLVNLAAFDIEFTGKPPKPPLATLTWKDWKGDPVIGFPRRGSAQKPVRPPSKAPAAPTPTAPAAPVAASAPPAAPVVSAPPPAPVVSAPPAAPVVSAPPAAVAAPSFPVPAPVTISTAPAQAAQPVQVHVHTPVQPVPASVVAQAAQALQVHVVQAPSHAPPMNVTMPVQNVTPAPPPVQKPASMPPPAPPVQQPASAPPPPMTAPLVSASHPPLQITEAEPRTRAPSSPDGMVKTPSGRFVRGRVSGDELITSLFESMHDLHFLRDALDGGQFCLALATEVLPARAAIIHFFDVEKREWVVACTRGKDTQRLLNMRTPEGDEMLRGAARKRRAVVSPNASAEAVAPRYQALGGGKSLIIAPIMQAGRALGALEIINPLDGMPFTEDEGNAMTYIAEQYAEYLGSRGIVLDRDRIQAASR